jgi:hypothetical protein
MSFFNRLIVPMDFFKSSIVRPNWFKRVIVPNNCSKITYVPHELFQDTYRPLDLFHPQPTMKSHHLTLLDVQLCSGQGVNNVGVITRRYSLPYHRKS